jgi:hypothetical protein
MGRNSYRKWEILDALLAKYLRDRFADVAVGHPDVQESGDGGCDIWRKSIDEASSNALFLR